MRANAAQFVLLVTVNALVGGLLGTERTVLPLLGEQEFHLAHTAALTYILAFGATKAVANFFAGTLSDRYRRAVHADVRNPPAATTTRLTR